MTSWEPDRRDGPAVTIVVEQLRRAVAGGIGTYTRGLLDGLGQLGHRAPTIELVASRAGSGPDPLSAWGHRVRELPVPAPVATRLWDRGFGRPTLAGLTHATSFAYPRPRGRFVVTVHDLAFREVPDAFPERGRAWHEARLADALARADRFVVPTSRTADALVAAGASPGSVEVIGHGCDHLPAADRAAAARLLAGAGINDRFLLTVGTLEPRKNLGRLFEAYAGSGLLGAGWRLAVVGADGWGESVRHPPHGVHLLGSPPDEVLAGLYEEAEAFVYVPLVEGFGLPPVEAMRVGTAVIASTQVPSVTGVAHLVDAHSVDDISRALSRLADDDFRAELVADGLTHVFGMTWQRSAAAHADLWERLQ